MEESLDLFTSSNPDIMRKIHLLIVDHDVTRFHSYDMVRYELYKARMSGDKERFYRLNQRYQFMMLSDAKLATVDKTRLFAYLTQSLNTLTYFGDDLTFDEYVEKVGLMAASKDAVITATGVGVTFDSIIYKKNVSTVLLQYKGERYHPSFYDRTIAYEVENILDLDLICGLIEKHNINAIMVSSIHTVTALAFMLANRSHHPTTTFMFPSFGYNFSNPESLTFHPDIAKTLEFLQVKYHYEFGIYDPFTGYNRRRLNHESDDKHSE